MKPYHIVVSEKAKADIDNLFVFIVTEYKSEHTANQYIDGLENEIKALAFSAEIYRIRTDAFFAQFGQNIRRVNYKKMAIIYSFYFDAVYIERILPPSIITS